MSTLVHLLMEARTGEGTYTWASSGDVYTGTFVDGARTGEGTYTFGGNSSWSGDVYTGAFVDGNHHGIGTYTWLTVMFTRVHG